MFNGSHVIIYSQDAEADRAFLRDAIGLPNVDTGGGWLIFKLPPAEIAVHPTDGPPTHELYFMCDDLAGTLDKLKAAGATVSSSPSDQRWGVVAEIALPSGARIGVYQPRHSVAYALE
jgi:catechol 2,3-dioxygenase-like lactoylglutathione lyase family enzyme